MNVKYSCAFHFLISNALIYLNPIVIFYCSGSQINIFLSLTQPCVILLNPYHFLTFIYSILNSKLYLVLGYENICSTQTQRMLKCPEEASS